MRVAPLLCLLSAAPTSGFHALPAPQKSFARAQPPNTPHDLFGGRVRLQADDPFDVPRPDPAILVSAKPEAEQKLWIAGIGAGIAAGVAVLVALISAIDPLLPADVVSFVGNANAVLIGLFFAGLGVAHFAVKDAFTGVVPPLGTWGGLWQVPAPGAELKLSYAEYHVAWTGVAEVGGGRSSRRRAWASCPPRCSKSTPSSSSCSRSPSRRPTSTSSPTTLRWWAPGRR